MKIRLIPRNAVLALFGAVGLAVLAGCSWPRGWAGFGGRDERGGGGGGLRSRPVQPVGPMQAAWVARFHYRGPDDIRAIMSNIRRLGLNTVLWQVRGEATVAYPSKIEPWSQEYNFRDPGFDPLKIAVQEAHRNGLRIEAWVNVTPGWKGVRPPASPAHVYNKHPDWFLYDEQGRRQPLVTLNPETKRNEAFYVLLNPCLPEVRRHIVSVFEEIVTNYDVDGLHLDYVRFAWDTIPGGRDRFPRDARTLQLFRQQTGLDPDRDKRAWDDWRANQLTSIVAETRRMLDRRRPGALLTAAVWGDPNKGYNDFLQNATAWLRAGLLDAAMPMAYTPDLSKFMEKVEMYRSAAPGRHVVPGIGAYLHDRSGEFEAQFDQAQRWGGEFAIFSYESLFALPSETRGGGRPDPSQEQLREQRRAAVSRVTATAGRPG